MVALVLVNSLRREVTLWREKSERGAPREVVTPGSVERVDPVSGGAQFVFSRLQLEARYVADDVLLLSWGPGPAPVPYAIAGERSVSPVPSVLVVDRGTGGWDLVSEALILHVGVDGGTEVRCRDGTVLRRAAPPVRRGRSW